MKKEFLIVLVWVLSTATGYSQIRLSALPKAPDVDTDSYFMGIEYNGTSYTNYIFPFNRLVTALKDTFAGGGGSGTVTSVTAGTGLSGGTITSSGTISMPNVGTAGTYGDAGHIPAITTDAEGRVSGVSTYTFACGTGTVTSVTASAPLTGGGYHHEREHRV